MSSTQKHLNHLETVGLIKLAQTHPELEFMFRHALVREVAYKSLLREDRKKLHRQVGEAIEQTYPERLEEFAAVLGNHFEIAGDDQRALKYFTMAGDTDFGIHANTEAVSHYTRALKIAKKIEVSSEELIHLYTNLGRVLELNSQFDEAMEIYQEMEQLAYERDDQPMTLAALVAQITLYMTPNPLHEPAQGQTLGEETLALARKLGDQAAEAKTLWNLALGGMWSGRTFEGINYGEQAATLARGLDQPELLAFALNDLGMLHLTVTHLEAAKETLHEAQALWRELGNLPMLTDNLNIACATHVIGGEYDQAIALSDEAFQISQNSNNLWGQSFSRMMASWAHWEQGQPNLAIAKSKESLQLGELAGFIGAQVLAGGYLADVYVGLGAIERGLEMARQAVTAAESQFTHFRCHPLGVLAQVYLLDDNLSEAEKVVEQGKNDPYRDAHPALNMRINVAETELALRQGDYEQVIALTDDWLPRLRQNSLRTYILIMLRLQSRALLALGHDQAARQRLIEARTMAEAIGARRPLWQILTNLAKIEAQQGNATAAETLRQQAREIVEYITDHIDQDDLRQSFLSLPDVRAVLE